MATSNNKRRNLLIILALLLFSAIAFVVIRFVSPDKPTPERFEVTVESLTNEIESLESNLMEFEVVASQKDMELETKTRLLEEKYDELNAMALKIEQLEKDGTATKEEVERLKGKLSDLRGRVLEEYKIQIDLLISDNSFLSRTVDSMNFQMVKADSTTLAAVTLANQTQRALEDCAGAQMRSGSNNLPNIPVEPLLLASNIQMLNSNNLPVGGSNRLSPRERVKISFELSGNELVNSGEKIVYIVLKNPIGEIMVNPSIGEGSGTFNFGGKNTKYSQLAKVQYQAGTAPKTTVEFEPGNDDNYVSGQHIIELYCQGKLIGNVRKFVLLK